MSEKTIVVGIDVSKTHVRVGGLINEASRRYIVAQGSRDTKAIFREIQLPLERTAIAEDAFDVVRSYMGSEGIKGAVVVVPNTIPADQRESFNWFGGNYFQVVDVISENIAVAVAYVDRIKPNKAKTVAVISTTGGIIDVSLVHVKPVDLPGEVYDYNVEARDASKDQIDLEQIIKKQREKQEGHGLPGPFHVVDAISKTVTDHLTEAADTLKNILSSSKLGKTSSVDVLVFAGEFPAPPALQEVVTKRYVYAKVWDEIDYDEVAAYGGAVVAFNKTKASPPA